MTGKKAYQELLQEGFLTENEAGWAAARRIPLPIDFNWYVKCIKTLGAYSVGENATIEISTGSEPEQILFRLKT